MMVLPRCRRLVEVTGASTPVRVGALQHLPFPMIIDCGFFWGKSVCTFSPSSLSTNSDASVEDIIKLLPVSMYSEDQSRQQLNASRFIGVAGTEPWNVTTVAQLLSISSRPVLDMPMEIEPHLEPADHRQHCSQQVRHVAYVSSTLSPSNRLSTARCNNISHEDTC